jgi:SNF2 family DNA or RNA helicase
MRSKSLGRIVKRFEQRKLLTATPTSNGICDIWHQAKLLDDGRRLGPSFYAFRNSVCIGEQQGRNVNAIRWRDKDGAEEAVYGLLADIVVRHRRDDCLDIPPTQIYTMPYTMTKRQQKMYDTMEQDQLLPILGSLTDQVAGALTGKKKQILAVNAAAVITKLLQIASGAVYDSPGSYSVIDTSRYEMLMDLAEVRKHPLMFFYWEHQRDLLVAEAEKRGMSFAVIDGNTNDAERAAIALKYQAGQYDVLIAHPQTTAHGFTFTRGTSTIWPGPTYNLEWFVQGNARQARIGQTEKTEIITALAENTREIEIYDSILMPKGDRMSNLLGLFVAGMKEIEESVK